ncbi:MAG: PIN domain-containing protein [Cyanobacteria bacterium P01_G01_bin.54]
MNAVFADTGFWVALLLSGDRWHQKTIALSLFLESQKTVIITSEIVWVEYRNFFTRFSATIRQRAVQTVLQMRQHPNVIIAPASSELFE